MPYKDPEKRRETQRKYQAKWYAANKKQHIAGVKAYKDALRKWYHELKESRPCADCNLFYPYYVMDFDHIDGTTKEFNISRMAADSHNREKILEEIDKCDLVCSNCHRIRTHERRN